MTALQNLVAGGADCVGGNAVTKLQQTLGQDRSRHQDRFGPQQLQQQQGPSAGFDLPLHQRHHPLAHAQGGASADYAAFVPQQQMHAPPAAYDVGAFDMGAMDQALGPSWATDFERHQHAGHNRPLVSSPGVSASTAPVVGWASEFQQHQQQQQQQQGKGKQVAMPPSTIGGQAVTQPWAAARMAQRMNYPQTMMGMTSPFASQQQHHQQQQQQQQQQEKLEAMSREFQQAFEDASKDAHEETSMPDLVDWFKKEQEKFGDEASGKPRTASELAETAGRLLDVVDATNPKFKNSEFLEFIRKLRDEEVSIEGDKVIENISPAKGAQDFVRKLNADINLNNWEEDLSAVGKTGGLSSLADDKARQRAWVESAVNDLEPKQSTLENSDKDITWTDEFLANNDMTMDQNPFSMNKDDFDTSYHAVGPQFSNYEYIAGNPYMDQPMEFLIDVSKHTSLTESILALEAAVQKDPQNALAWYYLGLRQQENERDISAIAALKRATEANPDLLECWVALAVSYTNESYKADAYKALQSWIERSKYKHLMQKHAGADQSTSALQHQFTKRLYLDAVRESATTGEVDADLQIGLGVIFNISEEYDKAVDCFEVALGVRPNDYMLWNKLGATLANSLQSERAVDAYFRALEINPSYIRARYNLAISCMLMRQYKEAAEHLLGAVSIQSKLGRADEALLSQLKDSPSQGLQSENIWDFLSQILFSFLDRSDLREAFDKRDLGEFRKHFDF